MLFILGGTPGWYLPLGFLSDGSSAMVGPGSRTCWCRGSFEYPSVVVVGDGLSVVVDGHLVLV